MDYAGVGFIQIDTGRIGGITVAKQATTDAQTHLALSASLQAYADMQAGTLAEYPVELKPLAFDLTVNLIMRDDNGEIFAPDAPGLGMTVNLDAIKRYLVDTEIVVKGQTLYRTPSVA